MRLFVSFALLVACCHRAVTVLCSVDNYCGYCSYKCTMLVFELLLAKVGLFKDSITILGSQKKIAL